MPEGPFKMEETVERLIREDDTSDWLIRNGPLMTFSPVQKGWLQERGLCIDLKETGLEDGLFKDSPPFDVVAVVDEVLKRTAGISPDPEERRKWVAKGWAWRRVDQFSRRISGKKWPAYGTDGKALSEWTGTLLISTESRSWRMPGFEEWLLCPSQWQEEDGKGRRKRSRRSSRILPMKKTRRVPHRREMSARSAASSAKSLSPVSFTSHTRARALWQDARNASQSNGLGRGLCRKPNARG